MELFEEKGNFRTSPPIREKTREQFKSTTQIVKFKNQNVRLKSTEKSHGIFCRLKSVTRKGIQKIKSKIS